MKNLHPAILCLALFAARATEAQVPMIQIEMVIEAKIRVGVPTDLIVSVTDGISVMTDYQGTVRFEIRSGSSSSATLPGPYTFTTADKGRHMFIGGVTAQSEGPFQITAIETSYEMEMGWVDVVAVADEAPLITEDANSAAVVGQPYQYNSSGHITAAGAVPMSFDACDVPPQGFTVDVSTGMVSWTPSTANVIERICVRAKNSVGSDEYRFTVAVSSAPTMMPTASLVAAPPEGMPGVEVTLDASGSTADPSATPLRYEWHFGDGTIATTSNAVVTHQYLVPGSWNAEVRVRDAFGAEASARIPIRVTDTHGRLPPTARIVFQGSTSGAVSFGCDCFSASGPLVYRWDFGNGTFGDEETAWVTYAGGRYQASLMVVAPDGLTAFDSVEIVVPSNNAPPRCAAWAAPTSAGRAPFSTVLRAAPTAGGSPITRIEWTIGDQVFADTEVGHTFLTGLHDARLEVEAMDGQLCTARVPIVAYAEPGSFPPQILSKPPSVGRCGSEWIYRPVALGTGPLKWEVPNAPEGLIVDEQSGEIRWVADPRGTEASTFNVKVVGGGTTFAQRVSLDVPCQPVELSTRGCTVAGGPALLAAALLLLTIRRHRSRR